MKNSKIFTLRLTIILGLIIIVFSGCSGTGVLLKVPPFKDTIPEITTGFYGVHKIVNGIAQKQEGTDFLGKFVYLYKDDTFNGNYFSGINGSFLPNRYIKTKWENSHPVYYWIDGNDEDTTGSIEFKTISENKLTAIFTTDKNRNEEVELRFYKHQLWSDQVKTIPIAHRGLCYQPPFNYDGIYPANTVPGFEAALRSGYAGFELDVRITKDNRFVVSHDENLHTATTIRGKVSDKNLSEIENALVIKSAAIPENGSTATEAFIAAPIVSLKKVLDLFINDPRLKTIVVDIKPDTDERISTAAAYDFKDFTESQQKKILFLTREKNSAKLLREICPYSDIALEGSIGPEPVEELEKYYPEAVGLPRGAHNAISFGSNILLAFKSVETSTEMISKAFELSEKYNYKLCMWTFSKEWRLNYLREHEFFSDFILLDVPYYKWALQQMRYIKNKDVKIDSTTYIAEEKYKNPIYKRVFNKYVNNFWFQSKTLVDLTYGFGKPNQYNFNSGFAQVGNLELKLGRSELDVFSKTNVELNENYLFFSMINSDFALSSAAEDEITTDAYRFGIGKTDGFGYYSSSVSFIPYVSQSFTWTMLNGYSDSLKYRNNYNDSDILNRYEGSFRFGDRALYGFKFGILSSVQINLNYETAIVFPRHLFLKWAGSFIIMQAGYSALSYGAGKWVDDKPILGPIVNTLARAGYLYVFYLLRKKDMNWPFTTEAPLRYEVFNFGVSLRL